MLISPAFAQSAGGGSDLFATFLPIILIFAVFYFLMIRPQMKRQKEHANKLQAIVRGDKIVTNGGLIGKVTKVGDDGQLQLEVAKDIKVQVMRHMVADILQKTAPRGKAARPAQNTQQNAQPTSLLGKLFGGKGGNDNAPPERDSPKKNRNAKTPASKKDKA